MQTTPFAAAVRVLALEARSRSPEHPTPDELAAYWSGELSPRETDDLQEHLALCRDCSQEFLDLVDLMDQDPAHGISPLADLEVERALRTFRSRPGFEGPTEESTSRSRISPKSWSSLPARLAAALLTVSVGLSVWNVTLLRQIDELRKPIPNVAIVDLLPAGNSFRGGPSMPQVSAGDTVFLLHPVDRDFPEYEVEIFRGEKALRKVRNLRADEDGNVTLMLPRHLLTSGRYRVQLSGVAELPVPVDSYRFTVQGSEPGL